MISWAVKSVGFNLSFRPKSRVEVYTSNPPQDRYVGSLNIGDSSKMARIFITGSSDGIGNHLAKSLIAQGHTVTLHARSSQRAQETLSRTPGASSILIGDLSSISQTKALAAEANKLGTFDAVIHNAGVGYREGRKMTEDGIAQVFAVNALAPYVLTSLMSRPGRVVYVSSGLHRGGDGALGDVGWREKRWDGLKAYSDSK